MQVLFIVLNDLSELPLILDTFLKLKVRGATILDSEGMAKAVLQYEGLNYLLDGPFQNINQQNIGSSKTIFTVIPKDEQVPMVVEEIQKVLTTSKEEVIGFMFTLPVSGIYPLKSKK
jgi:nitrogen regulatory protein PII